MFKFNFGRNSEATSPATNSVDLNRYIQKFQQLYQAQQYEQAAQLLFSPEFAGDFRKQAQFKTLQNLAESLLPPPNQPPLLTNPQTQTDLLNFIANTCTLANAPQAALPFLQQALQHSRSNGDTLGEAIALNEMGLCYYHLNDYVQALSLYEKALSIFKQLEATFNVAEVYGNIGSAHRGLGQFDKAITWQSAALSMMQAIKFDGGESVALSKLGLTYSEIGQYEKAAQYYEQALAIDRQSGDKPKQVQGLTNLVLTYGHLEQFQLMLERSKEAIAVAQQIGDTKIQGESMANLAIAYLKTNQPQKALTQFQETLAFLQKQPPTDRNVRIAEISTLANLGNFYQMQKQGSKSEKIYLQALSLAQQIGEKSRESIIAANLADYYASQQNVAVAVKYYEIAVATIDSRTERDLKSEKASLLSALGGNYVLNRQYNEAATVFQEALALARELGETKIEKNCIEALRIVARVTNRPDLAVAATAPVAPTPVPAVNEEVNTPPTVTFPENSDTPRIQGFRAALRIAQQRGDKQEELNAWADLGSAYYDLKQYSQARQHFEQAVVIAQQIHNRRDEGKLYELIGLTYDWEKDYDKAIDYLKKALVLAQEVRDTDQEDDALHQLGLVCRVTKRFPEAFAYYRQAIALSDRLQDVHKLINYNVNLGLAYFESGDYYNALGQYFFIYQRAVTIQELLPLRFKIEELIKELAAKIGHSEFLRLKAQVEADRKAGKLR